jgi:hypothetical protein
MAPDKTGCEGGQDRGSAGLSTKKARSSRQNCLKPATDAALKGPLLEENRHGELLRRVVECGSAIAAPVLGWSVDAIHHDSPTGLWSRIDRSHAGLTLRTTWASIFGMLLNRRIRSSRHRSH